MVPASMFPSLYEHSKKKNQLVAEAMHNGNWINDLMQDITTLVFGEYVMHWAQVEAANFDPLDMAADQIIWTLAADGNYSAKSAYLLHFEGCIESSFHKLVWQVWAPSRCVFHLASVAEQSLDSKSVASAAMAK
jgi:hypothetical protein